MPIRFLTAGDSHGEGLLAIVEGIPAGVRIDERVIQKELARRRKAYGRSSRQKIEQDPAAPRHLITVHRVGYRLVL